jgi:hypothetical protein
MIRSISITSSPEMDRGNGLETRPGTKPSKRGDVAPNLPAPEESSSLMAGRRSVKEHIHDTSIRPESASIAVTNLMKALNLPSGLLELGLEERDVDRIAEEALLQKRLLAQSPITVSKELLAKIVKESLRYW